MEYSIDYFSPAEHEVIVRLTDGKVTYSIEKDDLFLNPFNISVVSPVERPSWAEDDDDITFLSRMLRIEEPLLLNMIRDKDAIVGLTFNEFEIDIVKDDNGQRVRQLRTKFKGGEWRTYGMLSGGEKSCCQLDLATALASFLSKYRPCTLILDSEPIGSIDAMNTKSYIDYLSSSSVRFQTIWVSSTKEPKVDWTGWQIAKFVGQAPDSSVVQDSL